MVHPSQQRPPFSHRKPLPTIIFARNGRVRTFKVRLWVAAPLAGLIGLFMAAYVGATLYIIYRDDLLGGTLARQVTMQYEYEDRIAALRTELDRLTSRHLVETASVEEQLGVLLRRQTTIDERQAALDTLVERARDSGVEVALEDTRAPRPRPDVESVPIADVGSASLAYAQPEESADDIITGTLFRGAVPENAAEEEDVRVRPLLRDVQSSLNEAEARQSEILDALDAATDSEAEKLSEAFAPLGLTVEEPRSGEPQGGPFIPAPELHFVERAAVLARSLDSLAALRDAAEAMPVRAPLADASRISSGYGYRIDPFLSRRALHSGMDFVAGTGTEVRATGPGEVVSAGWSGGYGKLVEVRHSNGVTTRYGHLSRILVSAGDRVAAGDRIGLVGSTGRSTGPHLHYETRRNGEAVNPAPYLAAGRAL
jgi:murein DD-endopeptidase MepM/ murein hydrolase activator NlpD